MSDDPLDAMVRTNVEDRAMEILRRRGPTRASELGWELWGANEIGGGEGSHRNNKFCRAAGAVLARLRKRGLVEVDFSRRGVYWRLTGISKLIR